MKKGTAVKWFDKLANVAGHGVTITDEDDGHVQVAVLSDEGTDEHRVIFCTVTWLTPTGP